MILLKNSKKTKSINIFDSLRIILIIPVDIFHRLIKGVVKQMSENSNRTAKVWGFISEYSLLLILGALGGLWLANMNPEVYYTLTEIVLIPDSYVGHLHDDGHGHVVRELTLHYLVNDVFMALFFAMAGKEVWEAVAIPGGALRGRQAFSTVVATTGGMLGPVIVYLVFAYFMGSTTYDAVKNGWAIPTATDIAFAYLVGRLVFGAGHPAITFLLALAILDDAGGLIILAVFYPSGELQLEWLLLSFGAAIFVWLIFNELPRRLDRGKQDRPNSTKVRKFFGGFPYVIAGILSWYGFQEAGIHPALGLLPVVPAIPHAARAFGIFAEEEKYEHDLLNVLEHTIKAPVQVILFFFGFLNAGVEFSSLGDATWLVLAGLFVGKPLGIFIMGGIAAFTLGLPDGVKMKDVITLGFVAGIGFTVSLFVAGVAFPPGQVLDAAKMGALFSFGAALLAPIVGKILRVEKVLAAR